ncbi:hypothetical protein MTO96_048045 [Rhipicephalus appendiculatus]
MERRGYIGTDRCAKSTDWTFSTVEARRLRICRSQRRNDERLLLLLDRTKNNDAEPRAGKTASVIQSAAKETRGPTKSPASFATERGAATTATGHPVTAEPSKVASVQPGTSQSPQDPTGSASSPKTESAAQRRLSEELADLARDPPPGCSAHLVNRDYVFKWRAVVTGPKNTPFEGGTFSMDITFPQDYPNSPPKIKFTTKIYHPNVSEDGDIGLDILRSKWSPSVTVEFVLVAIADLMKDAGHELRAPPEGGPALPGRLPAVRHDRPRMDPDVREAGCGGSGRLATGHLVDAAPLVGASTKQGLQD